MSMSDELEADAKEEKYLETHGLAKCIGCGNYFDADVVYEHQCPKCNDATNNPIQPT